MQKTPVVNEWVTLADGREGKIFRLSIGRIHGIRYVVRGKKWEKVVKASEIKGYEDDPENIIETEKNVIVYSEYVPGCSKQGYYTKAAAIQSIKKIKRLSSRSNIPFRCYLCENCKMYHLTSKAKNF